MCLWTNWPENTEIFKLQLHGTLGEISAFLKDSWISCCTSFENGSLCFKFLSLIWRLHRHDRQDSKRNVAPKHYLTVCHLFTDVVGIFCMWTRGEQNFKISPNKHQGIAPPPIFAEETARGILRKNLPGEEISVVELFTIDSGTLRRNELSTYSLSY